MVNYQLGRKVQNITILKDNRIPVSRKQLLQQLLNTVHSKLSSFTLTSQYCMLSVKAENVKFLNLRLTRQWRKNIIYHTRGENVTYYTRDAVFKIEDA
jgi:hypothetical protein